MFYVKKTVINSPHKIINDSYIKLFKIVSLIGSMCARQKHTLSNTQDRDKSSTHFKTLFPPPELSNFFLHPTFIRFDDKKHSCPLSCFVQVWIKP
jgi:hypothetical protein